MTDVPPKPMPEPTPATQPFWDALGRHTVVIQYSPSSDQYVFYPRVLAPGTLADDLEWREISGMGTLYTFTIADRPTAPPWADSLPQLLAVVEWDEGPRLSTEMVNVDPEGPLRRHAGQAGLLRLPRRWHHLVALRAGLTPDPWHPLPGPAHVSKAPVYVAVPWRRARRVDTPGPSRWST